MAITGHAESGPTRAGFAVCDVLSGATAAFGVSSALFQRTHTGKGQLVDVSMLEATVAFLSGQVADYTVAGHRQQLSGNQAVSRRPTANLFKAGDGHLLLAVNSEKQYRALMTAIGRTEVLEDPRFADWFARQQNEPALRAIIEQALAKKNPREWEKILEAAGAPCASIWKIEEVIDHPQISARRAVQEIDTPYGRLRFAGSGFQLAHGGGRLDSMAPALSAHTDEVLNSLGYDANAVLACLTGLDRLSVRVRDDEQVESPRHRRADFQAGIGRKLLGDLSGNAFASEPTEQLAGKAHALAAKVANLTVDPKSYWLYTNDPFDNRKRKEAFEAYGFEKGLQVLAEMPR